MGGWVCVCVCVCVCAEREGGDGGGVTGAGGLRPVEEGLEQSTRNHKSGATHKYPRERRRIGARNKAPETEERGTRRMAGGLRPMAYCHGLPERTAKCTWALDCARARATATGPVAPSPIRSEAPAAPRRAPTPPRASPQPRPSERAGAGERGRDRKSTRLNSSHITRSRMPSSA